jgi:hypothetical protein
LYGEGSDASRDQSRFGCGTNGRYQHDVNIADQIDRALELLVIMAAMLACRRRDASFDEAKRVSFQIENLKARRSAKMLVNELPICAADSHAQGRLT